MNASARLDLIAYQLVMHAWHQRLLALKNNFTQSTPPLRQ
jgi:hypothetical protein